MVKTFAVNENNDIYIGKDGNLAIVEGLEATLQLCEQYVKTTLGELVLQTNDGIPYFNTVWAGSPRPQQFEAAVRQACLTVEGVTDINSFSFSQSGDTLNYEINIQTSYGSGVVSGGL